MPRTTFSVPMSFSRSRPPTKPSTMIRSQTTMRVKVWPSPEFADFLKHDTFSNSRSLAAIQVNPIAGPPPP